MSAYASKQVAMMKMLAVELAKYKIRVNAVCPGLVNTNISTTARHTEGIRRPSEYPEGEPVWPFLLLDR